MQTVKESKVSINEESPSNIELRWNQNSEDSAGSLTMVNGGFLINGEKTTDLERVLEAVRAFASFLVEEDPDFATAEIVDPDNFKISWELDDVEMMRFEGDGSIFILNKLVAMDEDAVARTMAWIKRHHRP